jgi:hypothetical protein
MPRFRNEFGSVVNVDDSTAARLGGKWEPLDKTEPAKRGPGRPKKAEDDK